MRLKQRLEKLEKALPPSESDTVTAIFFRPGTGDPNRQGEVGFIENLTLGKKFVPDAGESEAAFLSRYYRETAPTGDIKQLSDSELEIRAAGDSEEIAVLLANKEPIPDNLLRTVLEASNGA